MEILGCGVSRAGWSVMLCGYMEWNLWPQFDQKRCQHMLENPTCRTGNAYQGGIVLQGWHPTQCKCIQWKYGTIWVRGRTAKSRLGPVCGCGSWTASQTRQKNKLNSLSNGLKRSYREVDDWWEKHKTLWSPLESPLKNGTTRVVAKNVFFAKKWLQSTWRTRTPHFLQRLPGSGFFREGILRGNRQADWIFAIC